jgi:hypothetical protein
MNGYAVSPPSQFADRALHLLERVEHRLARTDIEKEEIYRLRYAAYRRENYIEPTEEGSLYDPVYDEVPNCWNIGTYIDGELASSLRIHVGWREGDVLPDASVFSDVIEPFLREGRVIVNTTRFSTKLESSRRFPELPYLTVRLSWMAGTHFSAAYLISTMRVEHQAYYKRVFGSELLSKPRAYPLVNRPVACMGSNFFAQKDRVEARYPFFKSTQVEREKLFGVQAESAESSADDRRVDGQIRAYR